MIDFNQFLIGFGAGSGAITTTACLLPLYPGMIAFLAGDAENERPRHVVAMLGVLVLAGVLTMMLVVGFLLSLVSAAANSINAFLLPAVYALVIVFGVMMYTGRNPFARMQTVQAPILKNPYVTAYVYGLLFGPMAFPCIGPFLVSAFGIGLTDSTLLANQMIYFFGFGLGFGWPLVVLPLLALPLQHRLIGVMTRHHTLLERAAGVLLVAIGIFGIITELLPQYVPSVEVTTTANLLYWVVVAVIVVGVGVYTYRQTAQTV